MNIPFNVNFSGRKGYREFLDNWTTAMPDCKVEVVNVAGGDEWTAVEFIGRGTHTGPLVGPNGTIPATQKKLDLKFCELLRVKDGQIAEAHIYFDAATMLRQFGLLPQTQTPALGQPVR
jgi:predicted ester cyclase